MSEPDVTDKLDLILAVLATRPDMIDADELMGVLYESLAEIKRLRSLVP